MADRHPSSPDVAPFIIVPAQPPAAPEAVGRAALAVVNGWRAALEGEPATRLAMFRFLNAMAAVRMGLVRELRRGELRGTRVVFLASEEDEEFYAVADPGLGEQEAAAVEELLRLLGGID